ncbi:amidohydrolase family protein [Cloacibacillus evryensis]|uniref:Amidohydrolase family protein n=1 Tax=Cloacibacillus evryensis TaxID=508460 RepID=A0AAW5K9W5_9BACT|nr:amidohydrolase family protein [Cloacibacillus evryensis]EXG78615.1 dihydroorotase-like cyclic amidohydrolase [Cloacibacillus evryensis DSM 19522]MCQ4814814.1 amidohydrolase family protein [Cloacibacillus evryensis]MEA5035549.1 amidohydrolase family protein [Cloacibacillus evryensis]
MIYDLVIKNAKVYLNGTFQPCDVAVSGETISCVAPWGSEWQAAREIEAGGQYLIPGTIDTHVHFRDPGHPERETFYTGSMAAAAGGVTTVLEHPISNPPQHNKAILDHRIEVAKPQACVDFAFYGAAGGRSLEDIVPLSHEGIVAYKTFLHEAPEGRAAEFEGLTMGDDAQLYYGMLEVAKTGLMLATHAENNDLVTEMTRRMRASGRSDPMSHNESRPPIVEIQTVEKLIRFVRETGVKLELAHISTDGAMELAKRAKYEGLPVFLETCPHYLFLDENAIVEYGSFAKFQPALRKRETVDKLWDYINDGTVDYIGSDHGPFTLAEKLRGGGNIHDAFAGTPGIDLRLPLMLDAAYKGKVSLERCVELLSVNPAKCFDLYPQKGSVSPGADADFVLFDLDGTTTVRWENSYCKSKDAGHVYEGWDLHCRLHKTIVRGRVVMDEGAVDPSARGWGALVKPLTKR